MRDGIPFFYIPFLSFGINQVRHLWKRLSVGMCIPSRLKSVCCALTLTRSPAPLGPVEAASGSSEWKQRMETASGSRKWKLKFESLTYR